eukprot:CAMPEP_0185789488 /NCGR_PEP_ID=MMETSP1174-20130828/151335_1 /TAXON_ID=35687 /ORGANISM="Dictyocha speculum, Strain CCMP1381" /LENGTH=48 /DNA_ID= /DNA_START= /DNA_END= /DNA_ORIENTATION=
MAVQYYESPPELYQAHYLHNEARADEDDHERPLKDEHAPCQLRKRVAT